MLSDLTGFFGDVTPQGAIALLLVGFLTGVGMRDMLIAGWNSLRFWYDRNHDDSRGDTDSSWPTTS